MPIDVLCQLGNTLGADIWVNIPHSCNDACVAAMATMVRDTLHPALKVYVEFSNEVWNNIFGQHWYAARMGCQAFADSPQQECLRPGDSEMCQSGWPDNTWDSYEQTCYEHGARWFGQRTAEVMLRFGEVFGAETSTRVVRVLAGQTGSANGRGELQLYHLYDGIHPVYELIDAWAVAPYFGGGRTLGSVDEAFSTLSEETWGFPAGTYSLLSGTAADPWGGPLVELRRDRDYFAARPELRHIKIIAYEGGQHFHSGDSPEQRAIFEAVNRDPRIADVYEQYLRLWMELTDNGMFVHYKGPAVWSQYGTFGSKEYQGQPAEQCPKYQALQDFIVQAQQQQGD